MRKITSIILALSFVIVSVTGMQMAMGGSGKRPVVKSATVESNVAVSDVNGLRQATFYPKKAHEWMGYIFIVAGVAHFTFNLKPMMSYIKRKS